VLRLSLTAVALVAVGLTRDPGCGGVDEPNGGPNAPCTRSSDCGHGLVCQEGVCRDPDSGGAGTGDSGVSGRDSATAPTDAGHDGS
jgi:hypothetical protein